MNCLIIDDQPVSRNSLKFLCGKSAELTVAGECSNPIEALEFLKTTPVELVFLDIHMGEMTGFDFLKAVNPMPLVVMTTSDKNFALEAFDHNVVDYLIKPVKLPRFLQAVNKVLEARAQSTPPAPTVDPSVDHFYVKIDNRLVKINFDTIQVIEAAGDYIKIKTKEKNHLVHTTLKKVEPKLPPSQFLKVHRSYVVNLREIVDIEDSSILIGQEIIPVSRANREELMSRLNTI